MNKRLLGLAVAAAIMISPAATTPAHAAEREDSQMWVTGYFPGWQQALKPSDIDFRVVTHVIYFSLIPRADGSLDAASNGLTDANAASLVSAAHAAHRKALVSIGGENSGPAFQKAIASGVRDTFVKNIVNWATSRGFDGVDIDMEPTLPEDAPNFQEFIHELRTSLRAVDPKSLLTSAVGVTPAIYKPILDDVDQINLMTYDMSGAWEGWETWYNSCLANGGRKFKSTGQPLPSCERMVSDMVAGGVPASKIGIGVCMYGVVWHGATAPNQPIDGVTTEGVSYDQIMDKYYSPERYHWDDAAKSPYLSVEGAGKQDKAFVSYDDARACTAKVDYVRKAHLGGVIVWELAGGYRPDADSANRSPLLTAIGKAVNYRP